MTISRVHIIYNPNSTGDGKKNAVQCQKELQARDIKASLHTTKHAGHAKELAKEFANVDKHCMVISSSGDGGYHEVANGVLAAKNPQVVTGVLPSGNANDHYHFVHRGTLAKRIKAANYDTIDVLLVKTPHWQAYAHSYAGMGMTSQIGKELTEHDLNPFLEAWLVVKNMVRLRSVKIRRHKHTQRLAHIVWSNIGRMSKVLKLDKRASVTDGKFEVSAVKRASLTQLLAHLLHRATVGGEDEKSLETYTFTTLRKTTIQLDGEVYTLQKGDAVTISCKPHTLRCIV